MTHVTSELMELLSTAVQSGTLLKLTFSSPVRADAEYIRIDVRPVKLQGDVRYQFASRTKTQEFHRNIAPDRCVEQITSVMHDGFRNVNLKTAEFEMQAQLSKEKKWKLQQKQLSDQPQSSAAHNRTRNYLIPEGIPCEFLIETGIMTVKGNVRSNHFKKFRQINRFLEFIDDIVDVLPSDRPVEIVDFGCGKSYLTFAVHYLFQQILKRPCRIVGLDRRSDVVQTCNGIRDRLELKNLRFESGEIAGFQSGSSPDLVISLHACDTATDDALMQSLQWKSAVVLAVPCCQRELNQRLGRGTRLPPLTSWGIVQERFASLTTDSIRAALMKTQGYETQILEFIETDHTPKNLLIRSFRRPSSDTPGARLAALTEVRQIREQLQVSPLRLERLLISTGMLPQHSDCESVKGKQ